MNQAELMGLVRGFQQSAAVMALTELNLCSALTEYENGATPAELAEKLALQVRPLTALLAAAAALGIIASEAGRYSNTPLSAEFLAESGRRYLGEQLKGYATQYLAWANLPQAVRENKIILPSLHDEVTDDPALRQLLMGLHTGGKTVARVIEPLMANYLKSAKRLLDVGCGAGTFALAFAEKYPGLEVTLFDQPSVLEIAREVVADSPAKARVSYRPGNYKTDNLGESEFDLVLFFQVLRTESPETIRLLLKKAAHALPEGGTVAIYDTWLEDGRTAPAENVFQNLSLALMYTEGALFTPAELSGWLVEAGFKPPQAHPFTTVRPMVLYLAERV